MKDVPKNSTVTMPLSELVDLQNQLELVVRHNDKVESAIKVLFQKTVTEILNAAALAEASKTRYELHNAMINGRL